MNYRTSTGRHINLKAIVAMDKTGSIGYGNDLIFHNAKDLKMFKEKTMGHMCVMGSKTFDSIGRILPGRQTIIVTHREDEYNQKIKEMKLPEDTEPPIIIQAKSGKSLAIAILELAKYADEETIWVCGGAAIYNLLRPYIKTWIVTVYQIDIEADGEKYGLLPKDYDPHKIARIDSQFNGCYGLMEKNTYELPSGESIEYCVRSFVKDMLPPAGYAYDECNYGIIGRRYNRRMGL